MSVVARNENNIYIHFGSEQWNSPELLGAKLTYFFTFAALQLRLKIEK